ncbi:tRNA1(Val) (adenine(37)-N6)-methyltransferase [Desulfocurvus sp. DL9XJH121]
MPQASAQDGGEVRAYFPRGLVQPSAGFRFSLDSLLLACFARPGGASRVLDLGAGCGVVGLGLMLRPDGDGLHVTGLDADPEMTACARDNAARLGLAERYAALHGDVAVAREHADLVPESFDLVVCNPPYRAPGTGRRPPDPGRDAARFEASAPIAAFVDAAALLLANRRRAAFIGLPERLPELLADMAARRLSPKRLLCVHSRADEPARLALVEAVKNGGPGLVVEPPLVLYEGRGEESRLSASALAFCPFLACNARA